MKLFMTLSQTHPVVRLTTSSGIYKTSTLPNAQTQSTNINSINSREMDITQTNAEQNLGLMHRVVSEIQEQGNFALIDELTHPNFYNHSAHDSLPKDKSGVFAIMKLIHEVFKDIKIEILHCITQGNVIATNKILRGRQVGEWIGSPATGKVMEFGIMDFVTIEDGMMKEHWARLGPVTAVA